MHFDSKQERFEFTRSLCALIYNKFRLMTHASPTKIMAIGDELQHAVYIHAIYCECKMIV